MDRKTLRAALAEIGRKGGKIGGKVKSEAKAAAARANGARGGRPPLYTALWGHPVPFSLTVQYRGRSLRRMTPTARAWLRKQLHERGLTLARIEGAYVWFDPIA